jgi:hypothetical protein
VNRERQVCRPSDLWDSDTSPDLTLHPDSETTPLLPTPHASTVPVQDAGSGTSSCKRVANGSAVHKVLCQSPKIFKSVIDTFREMGAVVGDMLECLLYLAKEAAAPRDSGNHGSELTEHLVPAVRFGSGEPHLCAQCCASVARASGERPRMTWRVVHAASPLS